MVFVVTNQCRYTYLNYQSRVVGHFDKRLRGSDLELGADKVGAVGYPEHDAAKFGTFVLEQDSPVIKVILSELKNGYGRIVDQKNVAVGDGVVAVLDVLGLGVNVQVDEPKVVPGQQLLIILNDLKQKKAHK